METHTEPVAGVTAISLHGSRTPNKRLVMVSDDAPHSKKRRKQSRPIRIPTPTSPLHIATTEGEEAEEGEITANTEHTEQVHVSSEPSAGYSSSVHSLLPSLLSFSPHFLLPMLPAVPQQTTPNPAPPRIFNLEAYCELCSKEFCNKYFLKTHKANRHGIYMQSGDTPPPPSSTTPLPPAPSQSPRVQTPPKVVNIKSSDSIKRCNNELGDEVASHSPSSIIQDTEIEQEPLSPGRLRRLGVINADAFCEICSKEYCNKYFLKTHKLKRHGIIVRDFDDNTGKPPCDIKLKKVWEQSGVNIQTSPLNLTVHEQATCSNSSDSAGILRTEEKQDVELSTETRDISADLQKLQTMLMQLNGNVVKSEPQNDGDESETIENGGADSVQSSPLQIKPIENDNNSSYQPISNTEETVSNRDTGEESSLSFSTSCYCDICNKELCNKYFKKVHMQKMHGIEIKDNALSGGVPCDICHKQLCSKYFVRVHKQNTHGIVDLSAPLPPSSSGRASAESDPKTPSTESDISHRYYTHFNVVCPLCSRRFRSAKWLKAHLINDHSEAGIELAREIDLNPITTNTTPTTTISNTINTNTPTKLTTTLHNNSHVKISKSSDESNESLKTENSTASAAMLSSLLRNDGDGANNYHCSYCNFTTSVLPLLLVHERTHTGGLTTTTNTTTPTATVTSRITSYTCQLCFKSFSQNELLQRHLRTHQLAGLQVNEHDSVAANEDKYKCVQCQQRFHTRELWSTHMQSHVNETTPPIFSCPLCPLTTDSLNAFKKHVKLEHNSSQDDDSRLWRNLAQVEVSRTLQDAARESHVPATYAVPQATPESFIMQPFLLEEPPDETESHSHQHQQQAANNSTTDGTFVPSLVFLPVREKVSGTLTVSFTLTPA